MSTSENKLCRDLRTCPEWVPWGEGPGWAGEAGRRNRVAELWSLKPQAVGAVKSLKGPSEEAWGPDPPSKSISLGTFPHLF